MCVAAHVCAVKTSQRPGLQPANTHTHTHTHPIDELVWRRGAGFCGCFSHWQTGAAHGDFCNVSLKKRSPKNIDLRDNVQPAGHYCKINTDRVIQQHKADVYFAIMTQLTVCNPGYRAVQFVVLKPEGESAFSSHSFPLEFPIGCWLASLWCDKLYTVICEFLSHYVM